MPQHIAIGIAKGDLDPFTKMPFEVNMFFLCCIILMS